MSRSILTGIVFSLLSFSSVAQKKIFSKTGVISFYSSTAIENIEATNTKALAVIDLQANIIEFSVLIKGFQFKKALMQEHFNENYMESDKYPKATFKGRFDELPVLEPGQNKTLTVKISGNLTMHGVTKPVTTVAAITAKNNIINATAAFTVLLSDYAIKVPAVVANNINKTIRVKINIPSFQEMK